MLYKNVLDLYDDIRPLVCQPASHVLKSLPSLFEKMLTL